MSTLSAPIGDEWKFKGLRVADLRHLRARDLDPLLLEETAEWRRELDWDFSKSADLVRKFADAPGLTGVALLDHNDVAGYGYAGFEEQKALIWDVYVRPGWRTADAEMALFRVLLDNIASAPRVRRIESQLMLAEAASAKALQREHFARLFERLLLTRCADIPLSPGKASEAMRFRFEPWSERHYHPAATVLSVAYAGHVDSRFNDRYNTFAGAIRYLYELVQFPGCATFCRPASYVAFDTATGRVAGIGLTSFIADDVGHIAELCVSPHFSGAGLGYELLRQCSDALRSAGAKRISLTVTGANEKAVQLYLRSGFREMRRFYACVWEL